jgi:hypothetical protein
MLKRFKIFIITFCLLSGHTAMAQNPADSVESPFIYGGQAGMGISHLGDRDTVPDGVVLPFVGFHGQYTPFDHFGILASAQYSQRGSNTGNQAFKYRLHYLDLDVMPEFYFMDYFTIRAGFRYAVLMGQKYKEMSGQSGSGYVVHDLSGGYSNQLEALLGIEAAFDDEWALYANYSLPVTDMPYTNLQVGIVFRPKASFFEPEGPTVRKIPEDNAKLGYITDLKLNNDGLVMVPPEVFQMKKLKKLSLIRNNLRGIPPEIGRLSNLEYLALQFNNIKTISDSIGRLKNLEYLDLRYNKLEKLPDKLTELESLQFLYLGHNELRELPENIGDLQNLQYLHVGKNFLDDLPPSLFEINTLIELDLRDSGLISIPDKLHQLRNLERLYVDFPVPPSVVNANPRLEIIRE